MSLVEIQSRIYLDSITQQYKKILVVNLLPNDQIFTSIIKTINIPRPSIFEPINNNKCSYVIMNPYSKGEILELKNISLLFNFLTENNFKLHTTFKDTIQLPNFICYVSK